MDYVPKPFSKNSLNIYIIVITNLIYLIILVGTSPKMNHIQYYNRPTNIYIRPN